MAILNLLLFEGNRHFLVSFLKHLHISFEFVVTHDWEGLVVVLERDWSTILMLFLEKLVVVCEIAEPTNGGVGAITVGSV